MKPFHFSSFSALSVIYRIIYPFDQLQMWRLGPRLASVNGGLRASSKVQGIQCLCFSSTTPSSSKVSLNSSTPNISAYSHAQLIFVSLYFIIWRFMHSVFLTCAFLGSSRSHCKRGSSFPEQGQEIRGTNRRGPHSIRFKSIRKVRTRRRCEEDWWVYELHHLLIIPCLPKWTVHYFHSPLFYAA